MSNTVGITFTADTADATAGFNKVGESSRKMTEDVDHASSGFSRAGDAADGAEGKARGFSDTLTGTADVAAGVGNIMRGNLFEGAVLAGTGFADLAGGLAQFVIPMLQGTRIATLAQAGAQRVVAAASKVWAGVQWLVNAALTANPIGLIVVGIGILVGVIVYLVKHTRFFGELWKVVWSGVKAAALAVWEWIRKLPGLYIDAFKRIPAAIGQIWATVWATTKSGWTAAWTWIKDKFGAAWNWVLGLPASLKPAFAAVIDFITSPFKAAFNLVADFWNKTMGKISFKVPDWVPGMGGKTWGFPQVQKLHAGGIVGGIPGTVVPILAMAGERVSSPASGGAATTVRIGSDGSRLGDALVDLIADAVRGRGGDPAALGLVTASGS